MPAQSRPIITLTTDFGTRDYYVAAMKAVLVRRCPDVRMIDITHQVPRHDILCGSITLERAIDGFLPGTVHLAVVDPGVGTDRRILIVEINQQTVVCPDNGLITWAWRRLGAARAYELTWRPPETSSTFHGRDIMAPVAAMLACGTWIMPEFAHSASGVFAPAAAISHISAALIGMSRRVNRWHSSVAVGSWKSRSAMDRRVSN
jgi:S-adenosyl-L-methionine hydrolase (adenosine-forming)